MRPRREKRRHRRLQLAVPVLFTVKSRTGTGVTRSGVTRDVSPGGVFFRTETAQDISAQQELTIKLLIPREGDPSESAVSLSGEARVVRTEQLEEAVEADGSERWGIAAQFTRRPSVDLSTINSLFSR
ncbi:MAG: PilZ domain-containing protein [Candidatus Brocadiia bacterium]